MSSTNGNLGFNLSYITFLKMRNKEHISLQGNYSNSIFISLAASANFILRLLKNLVLYIWAYFDSSIRYSKQMCFNSDWWNSKSQYLHLNHTFLPTTTMSHLCIE